MLEVSRLIGYTNEVTAPIAGRVVEQAESRLSMLMRRMSRWMIAYGFSFAL